MSLPAGLRLGPYEIVAPLGAGGMGEVYRASDSRLGREVAVKVLPSHLSANPEVRSRFEREARTVSSLNHPNICVLHDVGREGDVDFLVMELIEGETLATRLERGPLPPAEVLRIGGQIADALDRAHRAGVIHRDLKPGNVMLTRSGAKLMDFGLARATGLGGARDGSGVSMAAMTESPTMSQPLTAEGTIVGTYQYMSPEQLEGREADARADVWALGCVLYEMATGKRAFEGRSQASLISAIMGTEPVPISQAAPLAPQGLDRLVRACLVKDPADRLQSAHDIRVQLSWIAEGGSQAGVAAPVIVRRSRSREWMPWGIAILALAAAGAAFLMQKPPEEVGLPVHAALLPPPGVVYSSSVDQPLPIAVSPDGSVIAFCARADEGPDRLWVRSLDKDDARPLAGTEDAEGPFFSPDGRSLAFYARGKLRRVDVGGGPVMDLAEDIDPRGGTWNKAGDILFTRGSAAPISRIAADGGEESIVTSLDSTQSESTHRYPHFLPDGKRFLYLSRRAGAGAGENPTILAGTLGSSERKPILEVASNVFYASGYLLYVRGTALVAQPFDPRSLSLDGPVVPLVEDVRMDERFSRSVFAVSENGVLVCMTGNTVTRSQLRWLDREGRSLGDVGEPADYTYGGTPNVSPDGRQAVIPIANRDRGTSDVWLIDLETGRRRKLTVDTMDHPAACWLPDGSVLLLGRNDKNEGGLFVLSTDGTRSRKVQTSGAGWLWPMTAWGDQILFSPQGDSRQPDNDIVAIALADDGKWEPLLASAATEGGAQFSTDGKWVAYTSDETGRREVFVAAYPQPGGRWQVSQAGGLEPRWSRDGRELFYFDEENNLISVEVVPSAAGFQAGESKKLFALHGAGAPWRYDVSPDGKRFLVTVQPEEDLASPVTLITDWTRRVEAQ